MDERPNVVIVLARCRHNRQGFGIRFEEKSRGQWTADWAFAVKETAARREGYDQGEIAGEFEVDPAYPGCPHCEAKLLLKCGCGKVACWNGEDHRVTCPWCGRAGEVRGIAESLQAGSDR